MTLFSRKTAVVLAVLAQVAVLAYMAGNREYIVSHGARVWLRTAPVDPRDPFRGDYVRLSYDISRVSREYIKGSLADHLGENGRVVYAVLSPAEGELSGVDYLTDQRPDSGTFIKGRLTRDWRFGTGGRAEGAAVEYGIEAYFVQQGRGREMEKRLGRVNEIQVPLEMTVALGSDGTAVLVGHRWSPIGIGLEIPFPPSNRTPGPDGTVPVFNPVAKLTLMNASDDPLVLVKPPDHRTIQVEPSIWNEPQRELYAAPDPAIPVSDADVVELIPGEVLEIEIDFGSPRWTFKGDDGQSKTLGALPPMEMFRVVYAPPPPERCDHLEKKSLVWHGRLSSRAFNAGGRVD